LLPATRQQKEGEIIKNKMDELTDRGRGAERKSLETSNQSDNEDRTKRQIQSKKMPTPPRKVASCSLLISLNIFENRDSNSVKKNNRGGDNSHNPVPPLSTFPIIDNWEKLLVICFINTKQEKTDKRKIKKVVRNMNEGIGGGGRPIQKISSWEFSPPLQGA